MRSKLTSPSTLLNVTAGETVRPTFHMESTIKPKVPMNTLVMLQAGYYPNGTTFGAMLGFGRKNGFYVGFRSDFGSASGELECDENGIITGSEETTAPFYKEGTKNKSRMSITGGYSVNWARSSISMPVPDTVLAH